MFFVRRQIQALKPSSSQSLRIVLRAYTIKTLPNLKPLNSKISNYMRNGFVAEAQKVFDEMPERNTITWNAMIRGYFQNGKFDKAVQLYDQMSDRDIFSYNTMISGLMNLGDIKGAEKVFEDMPDKDVVTWNSMIAGYIRHGLMDQALGLFDEMPLKDVISWNSVIGGLIDIKELDLAKELFGEMGDRDVSSWTIMMSGLVGAGDIVEARKCFDSMPVKDVQAWNTIIAGYIKCGYLEIAEALFHEMPERDWHSWNEMIKGLLSNQRFNDAIRLFREMPEKCQRTWNSILLVMMRNGFVKESHAVIEKNPYQDIVSHTNMIVSYFGIGEVGDAMKLFMSMPSLDTTVWNATIFGLGENDHGEDGLKLFMDMKKGGFSLDDATYTSVLTICSNLPSLDLGKQTHGQVMKSGINSFVSVSNAMLTMYARCGNMEFALLEFSSMYTRNAISWNSIICGLAYHGHAVDALEMFDRMTKTDVKPNDITFVGVLSACSHAGLVEQGKRYFDIMRYGYFIQPTNEHYTCLVDLLGRFGHIEEALSIIDKMLVNGVEVPASVWGALLGACRMHKKFEMGRKAGERMLELEPSNSGAYMILAEMLLQNGNREEAEKIITQMRNRGIKKQPGCSWIEVNNSGHVFISGEISHPEFREICYVLDLMYMEMETNNFQMYICNYLE